MEFILGVKMSFAYGAHGKSSEVYNQTFNDMANILSFYECPDYCKGRCCKISQIVFKKDEYDKMLTCREEKTRMEIINHTIKVRNVRAKLLSQGIPKKIAKRTAKETKEDCFEFDSIVCPLLDNGKCDIHDLKPKACNFYPFRYEYLQIQNTVGIALCFLGESVFFDHILMCIDIYAKKYNLGSENYIIRDLIQLKRSLEQAKEFQEYFLNSDEGDKRSEQYGFDKAFMRLDLFFRYKSQINDDVLQQKKDAMRDFLQGMEIMDGKAKFYPDNYRDFIKKINEYAVKVSLLFLTWPVYFPQLLRFKIPHLKI